MTASSSSRNTTFISYGGPDAAFAERLHRALERRGVRTWFFPRDATPGAKLHDVMRKAVAEHERVVLICSQHSLGRPGVLNEIEQTLAREAREGGLSLLVPVTLDDYVFSQWAPQRPALRQEILDRVVADFRQASNDARVFERALNRLTGALTRQPAWSPPAIDPASPPPNVA